MNPLLAKIQEDIEAKVPQEDKEDFINTIKAGRKILYDPKTHQNLELVKNPESRKDPVNTIAKGIAGLGYVMWMQSKRQMPPDVLIPALVVLMADIMDFSEQAFGLEVSNGMVAATTKEFIAQVFVKLGVKQEHLQAAVEKGQAEIGQHQAGQEQAQPPEQQPAMLPVAGGA